MAAVLHISIHDVGQGTTKFFMVKDDSDAVKALVEKKAGVVSVDLSRTTAKRLEAEEDNAAIEAEEINAAAESGNAGKAGKGSRKRRKIDIPPPCDEHLQLLTDAICVWYEDGRPREEPESDVGTFKQAPKDLMAKYSTPQVGITAREDCPILAVVGVYFG